MRERVNMASVLVSAAICLFAISPACLLGEDKRNLLLIGMMAISPLFMIRYLEFDKTDFLLLLFMVSYVLCPLLSHPETIRWSTVGFTYMFCLSFMAFTRLFRHSDITAERLSALIKWLIYAFTAMLLIQQLCVLMDLPIVNISNYVKSEPWKLNTLTSEPSHSAVMMGLLMFGYMTTKELIIKKKYTLSEAFDEDKIIWICFLWTILTMGSGTAVVYLFIILLKFVRGYWIAPFALCALATLIFINTMEIHSFERALKVTKAVATLDERAIVSADHSASFRIVPAMRYFKMFDLTTWNTWFGHGVDYVQNSFHTMFKGVEKGARAHGGLMIMAMDFGLIPFLFFVWFSLSVFLRVKGKTIILFWLISISMLSVNMQLLWFSLLLFWSLGRLQHQKRSTDKIDNYEIDAPK